MTVQEWSAVVQAVSAAVIVVFSGISVATARKALAEAHKQADAAAASLAEAHAAVAAANATVVEMRRQAQLARVPFVQLSRPKMGMDARGRKYLELHALNLGPGIALDLQLAMDRQDRGSSDYYSAWQGRWTEPLLAEDAGAVIQVDASGIASMSATAEDAAKPTWEDGMRAQGSGVPPAQQPLVPVNLRFSLTYVSPVGTSVTQALVWVCERIELPPHPETWRLEAMQIDPGPGNGARVSVGRQRQQGR